MQSISFLFSKLQRKHFHTIGLILFWYLGFALGAAYFRSAGSVFISLMRGFPEGDLSIVEGLLVTLLPYALTALAVKYNKPHIVYVLCLLRAVFFSVSVLTVYGAFGRAGWLVQLLFLTTGSLSDTLLIGYWLRWLWNGNQPSGTPLAVLACISGGVCLAHIRIVSTILRAL